MRLEKDYLNGLELNAGELVVLENVRFNKGEKKDDETLSKQYASLCDIFVMDAFGTAHRAQASTHGVAKFAPVACAGPLLWAELDALGKALDNPARPMVAIVGGSKVSTKLTVLDSLSKIADRIIVGGGIANTFIAAEGHNVGRSLYEDDLIPEAKKLLSSCDIQVPVDVRVATEFSETAEAVLKSANDIKDDEQVLDIGDESALHLAEILKNAKTILWNGPVGVFEFPNFRKGLKLWLTPLLTATHSLSQAAVIPWLLSIYSALLTKSLISLPAVAHSWNSSKAKNCLPLSCSKNVQNSNSHNQMTITGGVSCP